MEAPKHFINCYVPVQACNFRCSYCYIGQKKEFDGQKLKYIYPLETMQVALGKKRLGGMCIFNLCAGGETLLQKEIVPIVELLLSIGHNVSIVTNGTMTNTIKLLLGLPDSLLSMLYIKFSFHYFELVKRNLMDEFFMNVHKVQKSKASFSIDITPCDELIDHIPEIKRIFDIEMNGAMPHISVARDVTTSELKILTKLSRDEYIAAWSVFGSAKFDYKISEFQKPHKEYCCAGNKSFSLDLISGNCRICDGAPDPQKMNFYNIYNNPTEEIPFVEIGNNCPTAHCYNCHALLTLGTIPELDAPTYAEVLDRVDKSGEHWLKDRVFEFYSKRLV